MIRAKRTEQVGPYLLVRATPVNARYMNVFRVEVPDALSPTYRRVADIWVTYPAMGVPSEWHVFCHECQEPPSKARARSRTQTFKTRERALGWLTQHRGAAHR